MRLRHASSTAPRAPGVLAAAGTALVSGVSVFVNGYGVHSMPDAATYTTAKNLVAALVLVTAVLVGRRVRPPSPRREDAGDGDQRARRWGRRAGLAYVAVLGGGVAFVLFFDGLARMSAEPAAFLHDTLVIWVALLCWALRSERLSVLNLAAIGLLVTGQILLGGGIGHLVASGGALLVLGATLLWSIEVVVAKRLLGELSPARLGLVRMGGGAVVLVAYLALDGQLGTLVSLDRAQLGWVLLTGTLLAGYVATWFVALERGRALDVTSVLVGSVLVTALLQALSGRSLPSGQLAGLLLVLGGAAGALAAWPRARVPDR